MPANIGSQIVSLIHRSVATSSNVNRRHQDVRQLGIYQGGYLAITDSEIKTASLSVLVAEISDGTYQVKVQTTTVVSLTAVEATPYFVLRWTYIGAASDFMEVLAVATPLSNDLVIGKCNFAAGKLTGFNYGDITYPRTTPNTQDLFLKVEPTEDTELNVRIRAGRIHTSAVNIAVSDQRSSVFVPHATLSRIDLVYINKATGVPSIAQGTAAALPEAPGYAGKLVLAEITLTAACTNIIASMIKDVRSFVQTPIDTDEATITENSSGKLRVKCVENLTSDPASPIPGQMWIRTDI